MILKVMTPSEYRQLREAAIAKGKLDAFIAWHSDKRIVLTTDETYNPQNSPGWNGPQEDTAWQRPQQSKK